MKNFKLITALIFSITLSSQGVYNLTYLDIPTQEISTFINLHDKITDMSFQNREGVMNEFVFTHFQGAGKGVVIWSNYASVEDVYKDVRLQSVRKTWESLEGEEKENFEKFVQALVLDDMNQNDDCQLGEKFKYLCGEEVSK